MAIYSDLVYDRRRFLHGRCGRMLEGREPDETALLAWHFEQGGECGKAAVYALRAGEDSRKVFAFHEALEFLSRALNLFRLEANNQHTSEENLANSKLQITTFSQRGDVFRSLGEMQSYQNDVEEEARIARRIGDQATLAQVHLREANIHRWFCRFQAAEESAEEAYRMGHQVGNALLQARAKRQIGLAKRAIGEFSAAQVILDEALQLFKELGEISYEIHALCNLSTLYAYQGDFLYAEKLAASALGRCDEAQLPYLRRIALGELGVALAGLGQGDQGRECLLASLEISRQIADRTQEIFCLSHLGWLENQMGRPVEALNYLRDGLSLAERLDSRNEQSKLYAGISESHRLMGNTVLAKALALKALELAKRHGRRHDLEIAQAIQANFGENL
jgi:tetratricopeptide (TPR) repeat protein